MFWSSVSVLKCGQCGTTGIFGCLLGLVFLGELEVPPQPNVDGRAANHYGKVSRFGLPVTFLCMEVRKGATVKQEDQNAARRFLQAWPAEIVWTNQPFGGIRNLVMAFSRNISRRTFIHSTSLATAGAVACHLSLQLPLQCLRFNNARRARVWRRNTDQRSARETTARH